MKKIIENLETLISSIKFVEQEEGSTYIISDTDMALLNEALNEALQIHSVMGSVCSCENRNTSYQGADGKYRCFKCHNEIAN